MPVSSLLMSSLMGGGQSGGGGGIGQGVANSASGLISGIAGLFQRRKAKKLLAGLNRPQYTIPNEVLKNQKMAEMAANEGMPSQQYANAMKNFQRTQSNALSASLDRRSALMALPKIQRQTNDATANLDAQDALMRMQNQKTLYGVNSQVAGYRDKAFDINQMQPYQRDYGYAMGLLGQGNANIFGGLDKLVAGGGQILSSVSGGGGRSKYSASNTYDPTYYNGYGAGSDYGGFETGFPG